MKLKYELVIVGALETNCYLVYCPQTLECAVVDPGAEPQKIIHLITHHKLKPVITLNTHGHIDHIGANQDIKERYNVPLAIHRGDKEMLANVHHSELSFFLEARESPSPDILLEEGEMIKIGQSELEVIHTPGHSPGSVSFLGDGFILSGDTLFCGGVGRTDLPGGSWQELEQSIRNKILALPEETIVLPGHGPSTTVGQEKMSNPFVK